MLLSHTTILNAQSFSLSRTNIVLDQNGDVSPGGVVLNINNGPVKIKSITWFAPDGSIFYGYDIWPYGGTPPLYIPGEYCAHIAYFDEQLNICTASACIYVPRCTIKGDGRVDCLFPAPNDPPAAISTGGGVSNGAYIKSVSPNPFSSDFIVEFENPESERTVKLSLLSTRGAVLFEEDLTLAKGESATNINSMGSLKRGFYVLRLVDEFGNIHSMKVVKGE